MASRDQPGDGWTVVLRRRPARMIEGRPEGGYTDAYVMHLKLCHQRACHQPGGVTGAS